ncbi:MaoC family dehydratase [Falsiroseomonas sp. HW251]|uniref:MaoC family dehydratase n=1 Tax=Falsiroseomonas sp. HW251 TaxID=3390998 RepID=UPI003D313995
MTIWLDDLTPGRRFTAGPVEVTEDAIRRFAAEYDPQPFHLDAAAAEAHPIFQGLAASGWQTAALTMKLVVQAMGELGWGVIGTQGDLQWPRPTRPGDLLTLVSEVLEVTPSKSRPDRGMVLFRNATLNQRGEEVQVFTVRVLVPRKME